MAEKWNVKGRVRRIAMLGVIAAVAAAIVRWNRVEEIPPTKLSFREVVVADRGLYAAYFDAPAQLHPNRRHAENLAVTQKAFAIVTTPNNVMVTNMAQVRWVAGPDSPKWLVYFPGPAKDFKIQHHSSIKYGIALGGFKIPMPLWTSTRDFYSAVIPIPDDGIRTLEERVIRIK